MAIRKTLSLGKPNVPEEISGKAIEDRLNFFAFRSELR